MVDGMVDGTTDGTIDMDNGKPSRACGHGEGQMDIANYTLSAAEHAAFERYAEAPDSADLERIRAQCHGLAQALAQMRDRAHGPPLIVIRGLPQKQTGDHPTPDDRRNPAGMDERTEHAVALCAALMGIRIRVAADETFPFDTPFHHVIPQAEHLETPAINNGAGDFPFHQDRIFLDTPPDYHLLAGVRLGNDPCATAFMDTRPILTELPVDIADALRQREFADPVTGKCVAVLREGAHGEYLGVDLQPGWILPATPRAERALAYLRQRSLEISEQHTASVLIGPGDLVIHDHHRLMHGRERFRPDFSRRSEIRWLIRAHAVI